jgi:hypothetical protein
VNGDSYEAAFALAFIGLREGEIPGLAWQEVDLEGARGHGLVLAAGVRREGGAA